MDAGQYASKLVTLAVLKKAVARLDAEVRAVPVLEPGDRKAATAAGARIGYVTLTDPSPSARVVDGEAWRAWVRENHPDEIVTVESVRSSFEKAVLDRALSTGEVVPGVEIVEPSPVLQVRPESDAEGTIVQALASEGLTFAAVLDSLSVRGIER